MEKIQVYFCAQIEMELNCTYVTEHILMCYLSTCYITFFGVLEKLELHRMKGYLTDFTLWKVL